MVFPKFPPTAANAIAALRISLFFFLCCQQCLPSASVAAKTKVHIVYMGERQHSDPSAVTDSHHSMLADVLGSKEAAADAMLYSYKHGFSGFAASLTDSQAERIADFPGVVDVLPNSLMHPQTTHSWDYLGQSYSRSAPNLSSQTNMGDGTIIGFLDSGIWPESESFNDEGMGPIPSHWKGECESGTSFNSTHCNRKLIGARFFINGLLAILGEPFNATANNDYLSPRDSSGHGSHCSSIAAGSLVRNVSYRGLASGSARGGAPKARLAMYKICWSILDGLCSTADMLMGIDQAIHDGVDVLSISQGYLAYFFDPGERDPIAVGAFHAVSRGITVVCAAGNGGPRPTVLVNIAPWILSVGASTIDRSFPSAITLGNNRTIMGQGMFTGGEEIGFAQLVCPQEDGPVGVLASQCSNLPVNNSLMAGKVVLCFAPVFVSTQSTSWNASATVRNAGGLGLIVSRNPSQVYPCADNFPCLEVSNEIGIQILTYIRSTKSPVVKLSPTKTLVGKPLATKVAFFSSRGPNAWSPSILKPDVVAPGVNILAASSPRNWNTYNGFAFMTGTSMATPHVAGIVALLKALHPDWSPAAMKSALVTTASTTDEFGDPIFALGDPTMLASPFDYGGGIVNPNRAADPGLVYDMGLADYVYNYLCSMGYNNSAISRLTGKPTVCPRKRPSMLNLNYPAITIPNLRTSVTIIRTVTNVGPVNSKYNAVIESPLGVKVTVWPQVLVFNSTTKKLSFKMTLWSTHKTIGDYYFGSLTWSDGKHIVRSPISVRTEIISSYVDSY